MSRTESPTPVTPQAWDTAWSVLTAVAIGTGLVCAWRRDGTLHFLGAFLLLTFVAAVFTTSFARAVEYSFRWRLIGWPAAACLALMSAAGLVLELGVSMLALIVLLGLASPWVINFIQRHLARTKQPYEREGEADQSPQITLTQAEIDRQFDDIVSQL
jgi:hypothetical protein